MFRKGRLLPLLCILLGVMLFFPAGCLAQGDRLQFLLDGMAHHLSLIRDGRGRGICTERISPEDGVEVHLEDSTIVLDQATRTIEFVTAFRREKIRMDLKRAFDYFQVFGIRPMDDAIYFDGEAIYRYDNVQRVLSVFDHTARALISERYVVPFYSSLAEGRSVCDGIEGQRRRKGYTVRIREPEQDEDSTNCIIEIQEPSSARARYWVNPATGFTLSKVERWQHPSDTHPTFRLENHQMEQVENGIWIPCMVREEAYERSSEDSSEMFLKREALTIYDDFAINVGVSDEEISLRIPYGADVYDYRTHVSYRVGIEEKTSGAVMRILARGEPRSDSNASPSQRFGQPEGFVVTSEGLAQEQAKNGCGPACLFAVGRLLGVECSLQEMVDFTNAREGTCSLLDLKEAAGRKGLSAAGMTLNLRQLEKEVSSGKQAIAHTVEDHFLAVIGFSEDRVEVLDPPEHKLMPQDRFAAEWDGKVLLISKGR